MFLVLLTALQVPVSLSKIVETSYGRLEGDTRWSDDGNHKYMFKSVPFAEPPLGHLRFSFPQNPEPWEGIRNASEYNKACMGNWSHTAHPEVQTSEDCLYINIFTNENCLIKKCPVMVYFHGGGFFHGAATLFPDDFLLERYVGEDVVFAIPAYRLGVFGQLYFGPCPELTENLFIHDVIQALTFVHNEISNFGGDPTKVTLMGHSVGGTMVEALTFSHFVDQKMEIFQQAIILSGVGAFGYEELAVQNSFVLAERLGCAPIAQQNRNNIDVNHILSCLRGKDAVEILRLQYNLEKYEHIDFTRMIQGAPFMKLHGKIADLKTKVQPRNVLFGSTEHEFKRKNDLRSRFLDFENPEELLHLFDATFYNLSGIPISSESSSIFVSTATYCEAVINSGADCFLFQTYQKPYSWHNSDMHYFIGAQVEGPHTRDVDILDSFYSKLLVNFTKYGKPTPCNRQLKVDGKQNNWISVWEKYDPVKMNFLNLEVDTELGIKPKMQNDYNRKIVEFWLNDMMGIDRKITEKNPEPWDGVRNASEYSKACMGNWTATIHPEVQVSEDCLYINIFTNEKCLNKKCPVLVYFHGGSFSLGAATVFPDDFILERYVGEDVVFAIPTYRMGVFGQLYFGQNNVMGENLLIYDVIQSLTFVHNEIEHFGGDPTRVTIMGHSSGGTIVMALAFSHLIDQKMELFQQGICLSGLGAFGYEELAIESSVLIAEKLGCLQSPKKSFGDEDVLKILKCLREKDAIEILQAQTHMVDFENANFTRIIQGAPMMKLGGKIADLKKDTPKRNMIFSTTEHESIKRVYIRSRFLDFENPDEVFLYFDNNFYNYTGKPISSESSGVFVSTATFSETAVNSGADVYLFESRQKPYSWHNSDMQYFIGTHAERDHTPDMDIVDTFYSKMLVNFTKYGKPSPLWEKYDPVKKNFLNLQVDTELGITPKMEDNYNKELVDLWLNDMMDVDKRISEQKRQSELRGNDSSYFYQQWWFYGLVVLVVLTIILVIVFLKKQNKEECQPLISR